MKKYNVIYADPPWSYNDRSGRGYKHSAREKYDTMTLSDIQALPIGELCQDNAVLFLWATIPLLPEAIATMKAWGFAYKTAFTWIKRHPVKRPPKFMGYWFRGGTEYLLIGIRGEVPPFKSQKESYLEAQTTAHSRKPECFRKLIEEVTAVSFEEPKRLELFARSAKDLFPDHHLQGWDVFGNEATNSITLPVIEGGEPTTPITAPQGDAK